VTRREVYLLAGLGALLLLLPLVLDRYLLSIFVLVFWAAYIGQAWNIMMGFAGLLSLGHALYVGLAAYTAAALYVHFGISPLLGLVPAVLACLAAGACIAWLAFRFRIEGVYFALLTISFAEVARIGFDHLNWTGGAGGFFLPVSGVQAGEWWNLRGGPLFFYYLALAMAAAALGLCAYLRRSRLGYEWLAVREDPEAARAVGINVTQARIIAVLVSAGMSAVAGVFHVFYYNNVFSSQIFDMSRSIDIMLAPIVGGIGTLIGPILGAFILVPLGELLILATQAAGLNAPGTKAVFFGIALMIIIYLLPHGLWPVLRRVLGLRESGR
jgi:branched-chain amino acid transport system permease protein